MNLHTLYKRIIVIVLLALPLYWLVFTPHGQHTLDVFLLKIGGGEAITIDLNALNANIEEGQIKRDMPDVEFECGAMHSPGMRGCSAAIATFNEIPARSVTFVFNQNRLQRVKLLYRRSYHESMINYLLASIGAPMNTPPQPGMHAPVSQWQVGYGRVIALQELSEPELEAALYWNAAAAE